MGDVVIVPLTVGIHFSETNNLAISTMIFAPTGQFRPGNLSNLGMGEWTVMPNFAHTYLWEKRGLEFDTFVGFDIYSQNTTTKYTSGTMFHWDGMVTQYLSKRVGFGAIGSNLTQITKDTGPVADVLHGFEGRCWGVGPIALYVAKLEKPGVIVQLRWINEFKVTNLLKGNAVLFGLTLKINCRGLGRESTRAVACRSQSLQTSRLRPEFGLVCDKSLLRAFTRINRPIVSSTI